MKERNRKAQEIKSQRGRRQSLSSSGGGLRSRSNSTERGRSRDPSLDRLSEKSRTRTSSVGSSGSRHTVSKSRDSSTERTSSINNRKPISRSNSQERR